jgi:ring-1,2-phenylacetyl-CoA epoxidase subunit PaaE
MWSNTIFQPVLSWLEKTYSTRLTIQYFLTEEKGNAAEESNYFHGRISKFLLRKLLKKKIANEQSPPVFVCGPYSYIELVTECLKEMGLNEKFIQKEYFAIPVASEQGWELQERTLEVLLHFNEQSNLLSVQPGQTILDAALDDKIALPYSCKQGSCGICVSRLTSGRVQMKNNFSLDKDQVAAGAVLLCQSHPLDDEVTVEVNTL